MYFLRVLMERSSEVLLSIDKQILYDVEVEILFRFGTRVLI
jgi:hypothetical protein